MICVMRPCRPAGRLDAGTRLLGRARAASSRCRQLWEELPPKQNTITQEDIANRGIDTSALAINEKQIRAVVTKTEIEKATSEAGLTRSWSPKRGLRDQTLRGPGKGEEALSAPRTPDRCACYRPERRRDVTWSKLTTIG